MAYKLLGSLVIFCPQLPFHYFHDGALGMQLKNVIEELGGVFQEHSEMFKKREVGHWLLLRTLLKMFSKGNTLIEVVDDLEQASSKVTVVTD
ncbi:hypothetical protein FRC12_015478 [Ceratobasidium sp. 428]|nr:hypothetical protein FRC12_015478 [Ceratobasidium sp. 428]